MAEKDNKPKTEAKPAATVKPVTKTTSTAKPAATVKPVTKTAPAAKPAATVKPVAKPAAKPAATVKPAESKPATAPKPVTKTATAAAKPAATAKPAAATKPAESAKPAAEPKPAAKPAAAATKPAGKTVAAQKTEKPAAQVNKPAAAAAVDAPLGASKSEKAKPAAMTKSEKTEKPRKQKPAKSSGGKGESVAAVKNNKVRFIIMAAVAFVLILALVIGIVFGAKSCKKSEPGFSSNDAPSVLPADKVSNDNPVIAESTSSRPIVAPVKNVEGNKYEYEYSATSAVGYSGKVLGTTPRIKPVAETKDEREQFSLGEDVENAIANDGSVRYPKYGYTMNSVLKSDEARAALIEESDWLTAYGTRNNSGNGNNGDGSYNMMDKDGYLYFVDSNGTKQAVNPDGSHRRLYKHTAADGMYYGGINDANPDLSDDEPGIVKEVTIRPRGYSSYSVTGVYAPAGEVIKIEISEADMNATGGIYIHIGQALYNGQSNNIWVAKGQMQRFPNILNTMVVNKQTATLEDGVYTAYVGSFIGGPLYIRNTTATFTATISGGVRYSHFILGYTTEEEYAENKNSTTPYFDLEVWNYGVLHSGPKFYSQKYSYSDLYKVAVLWEKVASVTTTGSSQGIVFLYDPFVAAGAAVAFPGRSSVNCPAGWMDGSLNYNGIVSSGSWGNFHEYHHNFQNYGVGNGGEVTNNGMTLVSYALFTKISSKRGMASYGGQGLGGWNNYTSATWALNDILSLRRGGHPSNGDQGLALYATLLHNFGANNYIQAKYTQQKGGYGQSYAGYFKAWEEITHNDMTYYFKDVLKGLNAGAANEQHNKEYTSMFVPVSSVYQTGRSYMYDGDKKYFNTMQPYVIPHGADFNIDLSEYKAPGGQYESGSIVIPDNFKYRIKSVTQPEHGTIEVIDNYNFKFKPDSNKYSGQIIVTLEIVEKSGAFKVDDVDLVLEFEQSHETNKMTLERTTYSYAAEAMYTDAATAYENGFKGYTGVVEKAEHSNPVQNCNTDIWFYPDNEQSRKDHADSPESHFVHPNTVEVLEGKLYFEEAGTYRIYLRGRTNCAVYYSVDGGTTYTKGAHVSNGSGAGFYTNNPQTYFDLKLGEHSWVYFKEILIVQSSPVISYVGLGYGKWTEPMFTMVEKYYDANGNEVASMDSEGYDHTITHYYDYQGNEVTEEEANSAQLIAPTGATYVNAYRCNYEFPDNTDFKSDYFYTRDYSYSYNEAHGDVHGQFVGDHNCFYNENRTDFRPEYLLDGDKKTVALSKNPANGDDATPWTFTVDLGKQITANRMTLTGYVTSNQNQTPTWLELYVSETGKADEFTLVYKNEKATVSGATLTADFELKNFRYYKLCAKNPANNARTPAIADIEFSFSIPNGTQLTPDNSAFTYSGNWQVKTAPSTFGHVYAGETNAQMTFKFNGSRLGILSSVSYGKNFEVTIDGQKVDSLSLIPVTDAYGASYISDLLDDKEHTVVIKCLGEANIDSIVIYK